MKQQIIELKKKLLLVELPEGVMQIGYSMFDNKGNCHLEYYTKDKGCIKTDVVIDINSESYGKLTDIKEDQFSEWVEIKRISFGRISYHDYQNKDKWLYAKSTAKESFFSKLEADGVCFSNPLEAEKKAYLFKGSENSWGPDDLKRWQEAEEKVWDINNCWLFEII